MNELERAVQGVLVKSEAVTEATDTELTAAERAELVRVMVEEGRERVREGRRWRRLLSQYEARCQRESRIKSRRSVEGGARVAWRLSLQVPQGPEETS